MDLEDPELPGGEFLENYLRDCPNSTTGILYKEFSKDLSRALKTSLSKHVRNRLINPLKTEEFSQDFFEQLFNPKSCSEELSEKSTTGFL